MPIFYISFFALQTSSPASEGCLPDPTEARRRRLARRLAEDAKWDGAQMKGVRATNEDRQQAETFLPAAALKPAKAG